ncbi:MAG: DUF58 domain-containing protein [candidate division WOR-3 bacterium]
MKKLRPYVSYVKLKKWGRYYAILTLLVGFAAVNSGNNLLYFFLGSLLSLMALSGFTSYLILKSIYVEILPPEELYARSINYLRVKIRNRSFLPLFQVYAKRSEAEKFRIDFVNSKSEVIGLLPCYLERRGPQKIEMLFIGTSFPMSFTIREMYYPVNVDILVFPHIHKIYQEKTSHSAKETGWGTASNREGTSGDFLGLKEYIEGESFSRIHWKKIKENKLYAKKFQDEDYREIILNISTTSSEEEIERIASEAVILLENGNSVGLAIDNNVTLKPDSGVKQKLAILEKLALLGYES